VTEVEIDFTDGTSFSSTLRLKRKTGPDTWVFRWYDESNGTRRYRKTVVGTVDRLRTPHDAETAVLSLRRNINAELKPLETVSELVTHYRQHELTPERKAFATIESTKIYLKRHIEPAWGAKEITDIRTVDVEKWLHSLQYAPGTRSKIRNIMSAVFNHAMRHEWFDRNPISKVRTSSKRLRETDVLTPEEFAALLPELNLRERAMVILAGSTGLRRSELVALTWSDIDLVLMQVNVRRSCVRSRFGDTKTEASRKPVPLHPTVARILSVWRTQTLYAADSDFVFPSIRLNGKKPVTPDMVLKKTIRPALERAGIKDKVIGWHSFRHSLATNLRAAGVDLLRHANSRITLEVYTRAISSTKREANDRVMQMMLEAGTKQLSAPSPAPSSCFWDCHYATKSFNFFDLVAGTTGLEPATSAVTDKSMAATH
jgi:integrase